MSEEQSNRLPIRVRVSYQLTDLDLNLRDKLDYRIEFDKLVEFDDLEHPVKPDAVAIEFDVRNRIAAILKDHPRFGGDDTIRPWVEIVQMSWRPDSPEAEEQDMPWLILPLMSARHIAMLYQQCYQCLFDAQ